VTTTVGSAPVTFLGRAERDLRDDRLRAAVRNATNLMAGSRVDALAGLEDPDGLRDAARTHVDLFCNFINLRALNSPKP